MVKFKKDAQSTIEYILLFTAAIALLIVFLSPNGNFRDIISGSITGSVQQIQTMTDGTDFSTGEYALPPACNNNGTCDSGENCENCSSDCSTGCAPKLSIECGVTYYDNCNNTCGMGRECPDATMKCTGMECETIVP